MTICGMCGALSHLPSTVNYRALSCFFASFCDNNSIKPFAKILIALFFIQFSVFAHEKNTDNKGKEGNNEQYISLDLYGIRMPIFEDFKQDITKYDDEVLRLLSAKRRAIISIEVKDHSFYQGIAPKLEETGRTEAAKIASRFREPVPLTCEIELINGIETSINPYLWLDPRGEIEGYILVLTSLTKDNTLYLQIGTCLFKDDPTRKILEQLLRKTRLFGIPNKEDKPFIDGDLFKVPSCDIQFRMPPAWKYFEGKGDIKGTIALNDPYSPIHYHPRLSISELPINYSDPRNLREIAENIIKSMNFKKIVENQQLEYRDFAGEKLIDIVGDLEIVQNDEPVIIRNRMVFFRNRNIILIKASATLTSWTWANNIFSGIIDSLNKIKSGDLGETWP